MVFTILFEKHFIKYQDKGHQLLHHTRELGFLIGSCNCFTGYEFFEFCRVREQSDVDRSPDFILFWAAEPEEKLTEEIEEIEPPYLLYIGNSQYMDNSRLRRVMRDQDIEHTSPARRFWP